MNYNRRMQIIWEKYKKANMPLPASARQVALWAIRQGLWHAPENSLVSQCAEDLSRAWREEYDTDSQGRRFRRKHAVRIIKNGKQMTLWDDIKTASRSHMENAFSQRRRQIVGDCYHLKVDVDVYNSLRPDEPPLQLVLDFTQDVREQEIQERIA